MIKSKWKFIKTHMPLRFEGRCFDIVIIKFQKIYNIYAAVYYKIHNVYAEVIDIWLTLGSAIADPREYSVYPYLFCMRNSSLIFHATYPLCVVRRFTFVWINSKTLFREGDGCVISRCEHIASSFLPPFFNGRSKNDLVIQ